MYGTCARVVIKTYFVYFCVLADDILAADQHERRLGYVFLQLVLFLDLQHSAHHAVKAAVAPVVLFLAQFSLLLCLALQLQLLLLLRS